VRKFDIYRDKAGFWRSRMVAAGVSSIANDHHLTHSRSRLRRGSLNIDMVEIGKDFDRAVEHELEQ